MGIENTKRVIIMINVYRKTIFPGTKIQIYNSPIDLILSCFLLWTTIYKHMWLLFLQFLLIPHRHFNIANCCYCIWMHFDWQHCCYWVVNCENVKRNSCLPESELLHLMPVAFSNNNDLCKVELPQNVIVIILQPPQNRKYQHICKNAF